MKASQAAHQYFSTSDLKGFGLREFNKTEDFMSNARLEAFITGDTTKIGKKVLFLFMYESRSRPEDSSYTGECARFVSIFVIRQ